MHEEDWTGVLKTLSEQAVNQVLPLPPGGRFKAMAREAMARRKKRLLRETLFFLGSAAVLLPTEFILLNLSGVLFLILQSLAVTAGIVWLLLSVNPENLKGKTIS